MLRVRFGRSSHLDLPFCCTVRTSAQVHGAYSLLASRAAARSSLKRSAATKILCATRQADDNDIPVVRLTGCESTTTAIWAMTSGLKDFGWGAGMYAAPFVLTRLAVISESCDSPLKTA